MDIFKHKSEKDSVINLGFLSLTFNDFQHFAIVFHLSPTIRGSVVEHFKVNATYSVKDIFFFVYLSFIFLLVYLVIYSY